MKIDAQNFMNFLKKFQFTNLIDAVVLEEKDNRLFIAVTKNDLMCVGYYDEDWMQEYPMGVSIKSLCAFLKNQSEIDITFTDRMHLKGKGELAYKTINPDFLGAVVPTFNDDPYKLVELFDKRVFIDKETKAIIQSLLATTQSDFVKFSPDGISSGEDNEHIVKYEIPIDIEYSISVKKSTLVEVMKKQQEFNFKFSDVTQDEMLISSDDVFYVIRKVVE